MQHETERIYNKEENSEIREKCYNSNPKTITRGLKTQDSG